MGLYVLNLVARVMGFAVIVSIVLAIWIFVTIDDAVASIGFPDGVRGAGVAVGIVLYPDDPGDVVCENLDAATPTTMTTTRTAITMAEISPTLLLGFAG